jgi:hypothetical protein
MGLGSGIRKKLIPDPGSRGQKGPGSGSRIRIRNTDFNVLYFSGDEEEENAIVARVLDEIGIEISGKVRCRDD